MRRVAFRLAVITCALAYVDPSFRGSSFTLMAHLLHGPLKGGAKKWMEEIVDDFGPRMVGTRALENAIDAITQKLRIDGFANVHTEPVPGIPHFVRYNDRVTVMSPRRTDLNILAIPGSSPGRIRAPAIVFKDYAEFDRANVRGKIVVFAQDWEGYAFTSLFRKQAAEAANRGAVGFLVKSIGPEGTGLPHTGWGGKSSIPAATVSIEEAEMLKRWADRGVQVMLEMDIRSRVMPEPAMSRNVVFDIKGSMHPHDVVVLSAHLDSWDVGQGALDDAGGCAAVLYAMKALKDLAARDQRFQPKRTIRCIFWTAEEQGFFGGKQYFNDHSNIGPEKFVFVSESDAGAYKPQGSKSMLIFKGNRQQSDTLQDIVTIINSYGIRLQVTASNSQGDVQDFANSGVPSAMYLADRSWEEYFKYHHSAADFADKLSADDLDHTAAIFAVLAHVIGNMRDWI